ncbi:MAG: hypothetical protein JO102_04735 [Elusimicrobia bacterium]|nr:hypothetical protein [Elusimicrobiota bacterium]
MRTPARLIFISLLGTAALAQASSPTPQPNAVQLLDLAYSGPSSPYQGRILLTKWSGTRTTTEEANVFFSPPERYRIEFLAPDGTVDRVVIGDGQSEQVQLIKQGKTLGGSTSTASQKIMPRDEERRLLAENYAITVAGSEDVMGRQAWVVDLVPKLAGKPTQRMWIDKDTNAILEVKRTLASEKSGADSRFTRFEIKKDQPETLFAFANLPKSQPSKEENAAPAAPPSDGARLAGGFAFAGSDLFDVRGQRVEHLRYTDGLVPVSLFVTRVPVEAPKLQEAASVSSPMYIGLANPVHVSQWKEGSQHYTVVGEVSPELLRQMKLGKTPAN